MPFFACGFFVFVLLLLFCFLFVCCFLGGAAAVVIVFVCEECTRCLIYAESLTVLDANTGLRPRREHYFTLITCLWAILCHRLFCRGDTVHDNHCVNVRIVYYV